MPKESVAQHKNEVPPLRSGETEAAPSAALPSAAYLGLPWRLQDDDVGYEINVTKVGWLFRILLDDTIGGRKDDDPTFRQLQKEHADFIIRAANAHHDMLEALKKALPALEYCRLFLVGDIFERKVLATAETISAALTKAEGLSSGPPSAESASTKENA